MTARVLSTPIVPVYELLTVEEAAARLKLGRTKVYELLARGELEAIRIDRSCRIIAASVDAFIARKLQEARNG